MLIALPICLLLATGFVVVGVYSERKVSAFIQDRLGPMEVGKWGLLQLFADLLKLLQKEDIVPRAADRRLFLLAPAIIFASVFAAYAVLPLTPDLQGSGAAVGVFYLMAVLSFEVVGILMAGWSSNNKYSLFGAIRSVSQIVSYEIPLGLTILCAVMIGQTLNLQELSFQQGIYTSQTNYLFGIRALGIDVTDWGGIFAWNILRNPFLLPAYVIFFICTLAESNRAPFDLPEGESEIVSGFQTEYSGMRWALLFLSEYAMMLLVSFLGAILFPRKLEHAPAQPGARAPRRLDERRTGYCLGQYIRCVLAHQQGTAGRTGSDVGALDAAPYPPRSDDVSLLEGADPH